MSPREARPPQPDTTHDHALAIMKALVSLGEAEPDEAQRGLFETEANNLTVEETVRQVRGTISAYPGYFYIDPQTGVKTELKPDLAKRLLVYKKEPEAPEETYEITLSKELIDRGKALVDETAKTYTRINEHSLQHSLGISEREAAALLEQLQRSGDISYRRTTDGLSFIIGVHDERKAPVSPKDKSSAQKIGEFITTERTRQTGKEIFRTKQAQSADLGRKAVKFARFLSGKSHREKNQHIQDEIDRYDAERAEEERKRQNPRWHTTTE